MAMAYSYEIVRRDRALSLQISGRAASRPGRPSWRRGLGGGRGHGTWRPRDEQPGAHEFLPRRMLAPSCHASCWREMLLRPAQLSQLECWSLDQDQQGLTSRPYPLASYYCLVLVRHPCLLSVSPMESRRCLCATSGQLNPCAWHM